MQRFLSVRLQNAELRALSQPGRGLLSLTLSVGSTPASPKPGQGTQTKLLTLNKLLFPHFSGLSCHSTWTSRIPPRSSPPPAFLSHPPHPPSTTPLLHVGFSSQHGNENRGPNWHAKLGARWLLARFRGEGAAFVWTAGGGLRTRAALTSQLK